MKFIIKAYSMYNRNYSFRIDIEEIFEIEAV